ncbi:hypothetical protein PDIG_75340 [Penicillium digitatum PHI26]|uniref:Uncharacterized protein n=2 Tax=Penicillium digitatum TaxID=36651 RepID=K9FCC3_PEND2|nr:hypothetical protein PDIP_45810 [Penicillium digitatum Pd1]EKV07020.1 hypothetical protein PDIG_75340 [Penicillium digitatum PHI26]EKV13985.1 hypothetical protein PDIP_45810 [Penicillium digitatum Pd1]
MCTNPVQRFTFLALDNHILAVCSELRLIYWRGRLSKYRFLYLVLPASMLLEACCFFFPILDYVTTISPCNNIRFPCDLGYLTQ